MTARGLALTGSAGLALLGGCQQLEAECSAKAERKCTPAFSGSPHDPVEHLNRGEGDTFIEILDLAADADLLYACTGTQGLTIWDVSRDEGSGMLVEKVGPGGLAHATFPRCQHVALDAEDDRLVITSRGDEIQTTPWLWLYDVVNPREPKPLAGWFGNKSIEGVALRGGRVWAATHTSGIALFGWLNDELMLRGEYQDGESDAWQPALVGDTLYVAEGATGLRIYDVAEDDPVLLSTLSIPGSSRDVLIEEERAYVAASGAVAIVDVSDPESPQLLGQTETSGTALDLGLVAENVVAVAEWDRIRGYDLSDATAPEQIFSELVPTDDQFSRVLTVTADRARGRIYGGEWTGVHAFRYSDENRGPDAFVSPNTLQFGSVGKGDSDDRVLIIENHGNEPLTVFEIASPHNAITSDTTCLDVPAGGKAAAEVSFAPRDDRQLNAILKVCSDDADQPGFPVNVTANVAGRDIGDDVPSFTLFDLDGNRWTEKDLEGNVAVLAYFATF